jgi:hypothetical protein
VDFEPAGSQGSRPRLQPAAPQPAFAVGRQALIRLFLVLCPTRGLPPDNEVPQAPTMDLYSVTSTGGAVLAFESLNRGSTGTWQGLHPAMPLFYGSFWG